MTETTATVQTLIDRALQANSPANLLRRACSLTEPGSPWRGRKKLTREEAIQATRVVTNAIHRFDLQPTTVLLKDGRANNAGATYKFFLTPEEMAPGASVARPNSRLALGIKAHADSLALVARRAREAGHAAEEDALLAELAAVLPEFLEQFRDQPAGERDEVLAKDIGLMARWLADPRRGIELVRFLNEAFRQSLAYDPEAGVMGFEGYDGDWEGGNIPVVPLLARRVASAEIEYLQEAPDVEEAEPGRIKRRSRAGGTRVVGKGHCHMAYLVGLGAVLSEDRRGLEMRFVLKPVTYVSEPEAPEKAEASAWMHRSCGYHTFSGIPAPGRGTVLPDDAGWFRISGPIRFKCRDFERFLDEVIDEERGVDDAQLQSIRWVPVTSETCGLNLGSDDRYFEAMVIFSNIEVASVLPAQVTIEGDRPSGDIRDRFETLLYAEQEPTLAGLLLEEARKRVRALEEFEIREASGLRARQLKYRARMRR